MQQKVSIRLLPHEAEDVPAIYRMIAAATGKKSKDITGYNILKKSMDARGKTVWVNLIVTAFIHEPFLQRNAPGVTFRDVSSSQKKVVIIGSGPAGLFAAIQLIELGIKPIILERGKEVRGRRRDLASLNKEGIINPESNYCFGEGGAGTYSDGKLYTRSTKRGNISRVLDLFVQFGADENILYEAHPHIGTNKLPHIITEMRRRIEGCGGEFYFGKKVVDFKIDNNILKEVKTEDGDFFAGDSFILATGHSARDIFRLLQKRNISIVAKPFALGVRIEHPQDLINDIRYSPLRNLPENENFQSLHLPPASYSLVDQVDNRGVFSFCMCPGGIIAPAATNEGEVVVNGWSPSKRNNPYANSGLVVQAEVEDVTKYMNGLKTTHKYRNSDAPLLMMYFQQKIEEKAFIAGGGKFVAPAQRMVDFTEGVFSTTLPKCSYIPGLRSSPLENVLPDFIHYRLKKAIKAFGKKMPAKNGHRGYYTNEAVIVATESRTSSPVRIPRDNDLLHHPQIKNLFPCGEGAGYAGGIVSAAMDGERAAKKAAVLSESI
ncbi:MAG: FAD-dependent protein [Ginsengibacter sp.]